MSNRKSFNDEEKWIKKIQKYEKLLETYSDSSSAEENQLPVRQLSSIQSPFFVVQPGSPNSAVSIPRTAKNQDTGGRQNPLGTAVSVMLGPNIPGPPSFALGVDLEPGTSKEADPELLSALGDLEDKNEFGPDFVEDLAQRWDPILRDGLKKEVKEELLKKYLFPKNCPLVKPPIVNPEIAAMLKESAKNRDAKIFKKQHQLACVLTILGKTMSDILTKSIQSSEVLRTLSDAGKLLADLHYLETDTRRALVMPMIDKKFIEQFKERKRDSYLYGEKLCDLIAASRDLQMTGKLIQSVQAPGNNMKGLGSHVHQYHRDSRTQQCRGRGSRVSTYRRNISHGPPTLPHHHRYHGPLPLPNRHTAHRPVPLSSRPCREMDTINTLVNSGRLNSFFDAWGHTRNDKSVLNNTQKGATSTAQ